ncbi:MAG: DUF6259 domain-containing protein [Planctomycetota bacterium]
MLKTTIVLFLFSLLLARAADAQDAFEWRDDFDAVEAWGAQPGWLSNASPSPSLTTADGIATFTIAEPGKGMKWRRELPNVWLPEQRFLVVRYRARNVNTERMDYFIYVDDSAEGSPCEPIRLNDVKSDGAWRTVAVDVLPLAAGESAKALAIQVQATAEGKAEVQIDFIALSDRTPEGAEELRAGDFAAKPDVTIPLADATWTAQPSWLSNPSEKHDVIRKNAWTTFQIGDPNRGMKWNAPLPGEVDLAGHRYVSMRYRARNVSKGGDYALCVMGQAAKEGSPGYTSAVALGLLISDGRWHTLTTDALKTANRIPKVNGLAVQVQAEGATADLDVAEIRFTNEFTPSPLTDFIDISDGATFNGLQPVNLAGACGADIAPHLKRLRITGWPEKKEVTVANIPFRLVQGSPNCVASALQDKTDIRIPVNVKSNEVFLLVTATYAGAEEPVYAHRREGERLTAIRQVDRFKLRLVYDDGTVDECMPVCLQTKDYEVTTGPQVLCAFADPIRTLKEIVLCDKTEQGAFAVSAATCRGDGKRGLGEFAEEMAALPHTLLAKDRQISFRVEGDPVRIKINGREAKPKSVTGEDARLLTFDFEGDVRCTYRQELVTETEARITIRVENQGDAPVRVQLTGPVDSGQLGQSIEDNYYLFPKSGAVFSNAPCNHHQRFCGSFGVQFMHVFNLREGFGTYLRTEDRIGMPRYYMLQKTEKGVTYGIEYPEITLRPGETFEALDTYYGPTGGNWHDGFLAYRNWVQSWYPKPRPEKQWFREVFNFRQRFLWGHDPMYDQKAEKFVLDEAVANDVKEFGGVDYLHIFDWGNYFGVGRIYGRTGDHPPYTMWKGGREAFAKAIKGVQDKGIPVGLYIEGYLLSQKGLLGQEHGKEWQPIQRDGKGQMWPNSTEQYVCSFVPAWREVQASTYAARVKELDVNGMYLDQFGFARAQRDCWSAEHGHPVPGYSVVGERDCTKMVRERIDGVKQGVALYSEETPCDLASIYQDGSFTYTMRHAYSTDTMVPLNVFRFAVPQFKTIEILVCDRPTGSWAEGVKWIFFNGEAMWIEGKPEWFSEDTRAAIRKCYGILSKHKDAFTSLDPMPLVPTEMGGVFANRFPAGKKVVYTLYNSRHRTVRGPALRIARRPNVGYFDAWNNVKLDPRTDGDDDILSVEIGPRDVGCIVCTEE